MKEQTITLRAATRSMVYVALALITGVLCLGAVDLSSRWNAGGVHNHHRTPLPSLAASNGDLQSDSAPPSTDGWQQERPAAG